MIVALDASVLIFFFEKDAKSPNDPDTGEPLHRCYDRVNHLILELAANSAKIIIPTPALAEVLVMANGAATEWLNIINKSRHFEVVDFDMLAAVEHAAQMNVAPKPLTQGKQKAKFDYQIVSIARTAGASIIYSSDKHVKKAAGSELTVLGVLDLPLPPEQAQKRLFED
ncbi:PIN domain-containing protein [Paracoccus saliphilus]|uniref:PIN domain-containing protein n=1 Tax=Paracoccus saliphilus TaxID=405559 RepID=A0AA46A5T0_9RHOB|nr:PIN domain-containing protein [Paracoccus saliphilus]WCR04562.1 PIN domain-containing protein [Paracoccus saliphilus]SIS86830.1 PIN domain-containing protein [Paracoccus saliphilus]